jgi:NAD(P)-dependent dehydrogenase (short-subunit alcohol dehydrogenase family)
LIDMQKTILITGSTDGIGLATAKMLVSKGHRVLVHGRSQAKLERAEELLSGLPGAGKVESYKADLSHMPDVEGLAKAVAEKHDVLDVLINNAGILKVANPITQDGLDVRFVVNTIAPYLLTQRFLPLMGQSGRVVNVSSAGQAPVDVQALAGRVRIVDDYNAYAQSKLAITMWSRHMAQSGKGDVPVIVAVNPGSLLGSKMVQEGFGVAGGDINIGADILTRAALSDEFAAATGQYFDNDAGRFSSPHPDALDAGKSAQIVRAIETLLADLAR